MVNVAFIVGNQPACRRDFHANEMLYAGLPSGERAACADISSTSISAPSSIAPSRTLSSAPASAAASIPRAVAARKIASGSLVSATRTAS